MTHTEEIIKLPPKSKISKVAQNADKNSFIAFLEDSPKEIINIGTKSMSDIWSSVPLPLEMQFLFCMLSNK